MHSNNLLKTIVFELNSVRCFIETLLIELNAAMRFGCYPINSTQCIYCSDLLHPCSIVYVLIFRYTCSFCKVLLMFANKRKAINNRLYPVFMALFCFCVIEKQKFTPAPKSRVHCAPAGADL